MREEPAAAAVTRLNLVEDHHRTRGVALLAHGTQEVVRCHTYAAHALYTLDDDGSIGAAAKLRTHRLDIVQRRECHLIGTVHGSLYRGVVRNGHGQTRTSVEGSVHGQHTLAARRERSQLQGVLVGLGAAVAEEERIVVISRQFAQLVRQLLLQGVDDGIRIEPDLRELRRDHLHIVRMGVTYRDDGMAAVEIEILDTVAIPQICPMGLYRLHVEQ